MSPNDIFWWFLVGYTVFCILVAIVLITKLNKKDDLLRSIVPETDGVQWVMSHDAEVSDSMQEATIIQLIVDSSGTKSRANRA